MFFAFSAKIILSTMVMTILTVSSQDEIIKDKSNICVNGFAEELHMTYGTGRTDASIILIASNNNQLNCTLNFNVKLKNYIVLVIEFPDWKPGWILCGNEINKVNVMVSDSKSVEICSHLRKESQNIYRMIVPDNIRVQVLSQGGMDNIKIIATALKDASTKTCDSTETECKKDEKIYCMSKALQCDTHYNCGVKDKFDEDKLICRGHQQLSWSTIMIMVLTIGITLLLILATIWNLLPKKKETFIFHGKEIFMEGFDNTARHFVVDIETRQLSHNARKISLNTSSSSYLNLETSKGVLRPRTSQTSTKVIDVDNLSNKNIQSS